MNHTAIAIAADPIAQRIKEAVLAVEPGATILLYGSRARGDARPDSDWDVLVLVDGEVDRERRRQIRDAVIPIDLETNAEINLMTRGRSAWSDPRKRRDLFQINVERDAVPLTPHEPGRPPATEEEMTDAREETVQGWLQRSHEALIDAERAVDAERWGNSVGRLYYAAFYAVTALLLRHSLRRSRHSGVQSLFFERYVKTGIVADDLADLYKGLFESRQLADYGPFSDFGPDEVLPLLEDTRRFVSTVERLLE